MPPHQANNQGMENQQYDFIFSNQPQVKRPLMPSGNSGTRRIIIAVVGLLVLIVIGSVVASVLTSAGKDEKQLAMNLLGTQQKLIVIATEGAARTTSASVRNKAATVQYALSTDQVALKGLVSKSGTKIKDKDLLALKDADSEKALDAAVLNNSYDAKLDEILTTKLAEYQKELKTLFDSTSSKTLKTVLNSSNANVSAVLGTE